MDERDGSTAPLVNPGLRQQTRPSLIRGLNMDTIKIDNRGDFGLWAIEVAKQIVREQGFDLAKTARDGTEEDVRWRAILWVR